MSKSQEIATMPDSEKIKYLENGWYRIDARGDKKGVNAQFSPPREFLAFTPVDNYEKDFPEIWPSPLPVIIETLKKHKNIKRLHENLPDIQVVT